MKRDTGLGNHLDVQFCSTCGIQPLHGARATAPRETDLIPMRARGAREEAVKASIDVEGGKLEAYWLEEDP